MKLPEAAQENLAFLLAELDSQMASLLAYFKDPSPEGAQKVVLRAGYAHNLWSRVQSSCRSAASRGKPSQSRRLQLQNVDTIARNLDQMSRLSRLALVHAEDVQRIKLLRPESYRKVLRGVADALQEVLPALAASDSKRAIEIGQTKAEVDAFYDRMFRTYTRDMRDTRHTEDLANALLVLNEVRRMGESLQGISEALLSISIGQNVQFERYFTLRSVLSGSKVGGDDLVLKPLAETRSGSAISSVSTRDQGGDLINAVFKDGEKNKVKEERAGVKSWHAIYPGLAPRILSYEKRGQSAALLIEHLQGYTFEHALLNEDDTSLAAAQRALHRTLTDIWTRTRIENPAEMRAMRQLSQRMTDVYRVHPGFDRGETAIQGLCQRGFGELLKAAETREAETPAPFSVYIHGDFNLDNVIFDPGEKKIRFIDLHRSRYMDYVQDVSVFMVSNYRLQVQDGPARVRIRETAVTMHRMAAKFARAQQDETFEFRLALGLARSFASSTRFVFDKEHARRMFLRARYLLELVLAVPEGREGRLKLPIKELFGD
ncbi:phosphotransferase [Tritonibacter horizontis]|uniref:Transcriptional regulator PhoU n=1 Tax=Tritonibacter horizontis TaxID=1768241 RepID=A0A132BY83_9RHOB|nr:phosphotransferase [Tritonibacter horizontis]KUP93351.1 transcriptional regulator PhoU [Tritonibacter horizontis]